MMASGMSQSGWLKDRQFDLGFIFGILALAFVLAGATLLEPKLFMPLMLTDLWLLGYHHVIATYTKLVGSKTDRRDNFNLVYVLLPLVLFSTFAVGLSQGVVVIVTVYFFWQWFHYTRQSWGIAQRYRRKAGGMAWDNDRLSELTLWSVPIWGILNRSAQHPSSFLGLEVWTPAIPPIAVTVAGALSAGLVAYWIATRIKAYQRGELAWGHTLFFASHLVVFATGYVFIADINKGWLLANVWHNAQYVAFVWLYNRQRFATGPDRDAPTVSLLSQAGYGRAAAYYLFCIAISTGIYFAMQSFAHVIVPSLDRLVGGPELTVVNFMVLFAMTLNFHHYVVDGIIWKRKRDVALAQR